MPDADGSIKLAVDLDVNDIKKSSQVLKQKISDVFKAGHGQDLSEQFRKIQTNMDKCVSKATQYERKLKDLENVSIPTEEYKELEKHYTTTLSEINKLVAEQDKLKESGATWGEAWEANQSKLEEARNSLSYIKGEMDALAEEGKAFTLGTDSAAYQKTVQDLNAVNNQMRILYEAARATGEVMIDEANQSGNANEQAAERTRNTWQTTGDFIKQTFTHLKSGAIFNSLATSGVKAATKVGNAFKTLGTHLSGAFGKLKNLLSHVKLSHSSFNKMGVSIAGVTKRLLALGLGITGVVTLMRKLRSAITEGLQAMAVWRGGNNAANQSISMLISSLNYLKASLAAAFTPILTVIAPILSAFMDMLARAAQMVGAFFAALTGQSTYTAVTKSNTNYAASISGSSSSTKKNTDETKKNTKAKKDNAKATEKQNDKLADFDDLNVLGIESQEELNDAIEDTPEIETPEVETPSAGGGGASPIAGFDEKAIPDWIKNLVDMIKDAWKNADFYDIGRLVGEKLRDALNNAADWLVDVAQPIAFKIGKSIATFLNGFFETPGLAKALGRAIGEMINTAVIGINAFLDYTHWKSIGKFFADGLNSAIATIKWKSIGHMFAQGINALSGMLLGFVKNFKFKEFGSSLGEGLMQAIRDIDVKQIFESLSELLAGAIEFLTGFIEGMSWYELAQTLLQWFIDAIKGINWTRLASALAELLGAAIGGLAAFLVGLQDKLNDIITQVWEGCKQWFYNKAFENGKFSIQGLLEGILEAIKNIGTWLYDNVLVPFLRGFQEAFGISSPSTVMKEQGGYLMEGLKEGILALIDTILGIWEDLKIKIIEKWEETKQQVEEKVETLKNNLATKVEDIRSKVVTKFEELKTQAIEKWKKLKEDVETKVETFKENLKAKIEEMKEKLLEKFKKLKDDAIDRIKEMKDDIEDKIEKFKENVKTKIQEMKDKAIEKFKQLKDDAIAKVKEMKDDIEDKFDKMKDKLVGDNGIIPELKKKFVGIMGDLRDEIKSPINAVIGFFEKMANGIIGGINSMIDALNSLSIDIPEGLADKVGFDSFGFNLGKLSEVSLPRLAQGAVIPPNKEFLAVLGDQSQGTNIEAPLSTIETALRNVLGEVNISSDSAGQNATMTLDGQTFARLFVPYLMKEFNRRGYDTTVLEG